MRDADLLLRLMELERRVRELERGAVPASVLRVGSGGTARVGLALHAGPGDPVEVIYDGGDPETAGTATLLLSIGGSEVAMDWSERLMFEELSSADSGIGYAWTSSYTPIAVRPRVMCPRGLLGSSTRWSQTNGTREWTLTDPSPTADEDPPWALYFYRVTEAP